MSTGVRLIPEARKARRGAKASRYVVVGHGNNYGWVSRPTNTGTWGYSALGRFEIGGGYATAQEAALALVQAQRRRELEERLARPPTTPGRTA